MHTNVFEQFRKECASVHKKLMKHKEIYDFNDKINGKSNQDQEESTQKIAAEKEGD